MPCSNQHLPEGCLTPDTKEQKPTNGGARFVTYWRVSTAEQGRSGLGLEAQQRDFVLFLRTLHEPKVVAEFVEVDSGGKGEGGRPELAKALELCRTQKATLLVAKLDRLSRSVAYVANLLEDKCVEFKVAQLPRASRFELHLWAALAEQEREFVSQRTTALARQPGTQTSAK